jgi:hypothetical protein
MIIHTNAWRFHVQGLAPWILLHALGKYSWIPMFHTTRAACRPGRQAPTVLGIKIAKTAAAGCNWIEEHSEGIVLLLKLKL